MDPIERLQKMTKAIRRDLLEVLTAEPAARPTSSAGSAIVGMTTSSRC